MAPYVRTRYALLLATRLKPTARRVVLLYPYAVARSLVGVGPGQCQAAVSKRADADAGLCRPSALPVLGAPTRSGRFRGSG